MIVDKILKEHFNSIMARNLYPVKSPRVAIKAPDSPRMKALNGGGAASGTLYTYPDNFRAYKGLIAAEYSGAKVRVVSDAPDFVLGETNKTVAFLAKFPMGKVPAFESADGKNLFESNAIAFYLADEQLRGKSIEDQAFVLQWISFADHELLPPACAWVFPYMGIMDFNRSAVSRAKSEVGRVLNVMNEYLKLRTFLVGERITLGDICCMCNLLHPFRWVFDPKFRAQFIHVNRWFMTMINQPQVIKVIGEVSLCPSEPRYDDKKLAQVALSVGLSPKKRKPKFRSQKSVDDPTLARFSGSPKKRVQRAMTIPDDSDDDVDAPLNDSFISQRSVAFAAARVAAHRSPKFPARSSRYSAVAASATPPSARRRPPPPPPPKKPKFSLDLLKSAYSSPSASSALIPFFLENFDSTNFSIWLSEYRYPKELGAMFQSEGLIAGMFQRLETMKRHAFAVVGLFGRARGAQIQGLWIWKGKTLIFENSENWRADCENYEWFPLDLDEDRTKEYVKEFFTHKQDVMRYKPFRAGAPMAAMTLYSVAVLM